MENPLISVIVPVYKVEKYLHNCINSVLNQSYSNWELILVNDGSPDGSPQICDAFSATDRRIKVIHKSNGGSSDARNYGIKASSGSFIIFLDSDDYWDDCSFLYGLSVLIIENPSVDVLNFGWKKYFPDDNRFAEDPRDFSFNIDDEDMNQMFISEMIKKDLYVASAWNKCVRAQFLIENNLFFTKGLKSEDMEWCGNILYFMPRMLCYDNRCYVYTQQRIDSVTATVDAEHISNIIVQIEDALIKAKGLNATGRDIYLSFFALQYLTLLYNVYRKPIYSNKELMAKTKKLKDILNNNINKKVKIANQIRKIVGYNLMAKAMRFYINIKKV